ncbi:hypothetical protein CERZMDRAFT_87116 [Cercospora zeae-maydis SCOH1-5]|uniref:3-hydroxy-3-methylglutaryl coenzyme A reductase n=1 Tax=Cercospora zeae-maydis SCOH1-5 TaxID=717836 RepID=A0A6A6F8G3_9PEZI|nr:hypothetical protein CERZMDRAFT_87116 [Cercospora zeae-maydis SCOH1-5]
MSTPASELLPPRYRRNGDQSAQRCSSSIRCRVEVFLCWISWVARVNPIITICAIATLASVCCSGLLEETFIDESASGSNSCWSSQLERSKTFVTGVEHGWQWLTSDEVAPSEPKSGISIIRMAFPKSQRDEFEELNTSISGLLGRRHVTPAMIEVSTSSRYETPQTSVIDVIVPSLHSGPVFEAIEETCSTLDEVQRCNDQEAWVSSISYGSRRKTLHRWAQDSWQEFRELFGHAKRVDIFMMSVSYGTAMLPFIHLFTSMRRLGSNIWLAVGALFCSGFACLFGLVVTAKLDVPITLLLLAEGTPFLIIAVSFEKHVVLARSVFHYERSMRREINRTGTFMTKPRSSDLENFSSSPLLLAIKDTGPGLLTTYAAELSISLLGTVPGVSDGLQNFCIFASWALCFDLVLLFTFYVAFLSIKLDISKLKQHLDIREVLENEGVTTQVAETIAQGQDNHKTRRLGIIMSRRSISAFKFLMMTGFLLLNALSLVSVPFKSTSPSVDRMRDELANTNILNDHADSLGRILSEAQNTSRGAVVTIMPFMHCIMTNNISASSATADGFWPLLGGVAGLVQKFENPLLSKLLLAALALSIAFNSHLLHTVTERRKGHGSGQQSIDTKDLDRAQTFNIADVDDYSSPIAREQILTDNASHQGQEMDPEGTAPTNPYTVDRSNEDAEKLLQQGRLRELDDDHIVDLALHGKVAGHSLESKLVDFARAVKIRRSIIAQSPATTDLTGSLINSKLPYRHYDWTKVLGACCENVIGYMPVPLGVAGPLVIDGGSYFLPMATTEGVLVASTSRGCKAINAGGGAFTIITNDGMTRGPCVRFRCLGRAGAAKAWLDSSAGYAVMQKAFNSTSRFVRLVSLKTALAGTELFVRFKATTGDAMGMNMISKGVEYALKSMVQEGFDDMEIVSVSGNYCTDKKAAAINWLEGRGKSIVAEAVIPAEVVRVVLKTNVDAMVQLNISKNLVGSAMAGSIGGYNARAANIVAALFIATGQDPAQVVESANCITTMHNVPGSLRICVSMPSIEVGTLGGGTMLEPQAAMLEMLGVRGPNVDAPGENSRRLARLIGAATLAGELSLCSALASGDLVKSHLQHNRSK